MGRWSQLDPIGFKAGNVNLFDFVSNRPMILADPSGLDGVTLVEHHIDKSGKVADLDAKHFDGPTPYTDLLNASVVKANADLKKNEIPLEIPGFLVNELGDKDYGARNLDFIARYKAYVYVWDVKAGSEDDVKKLVVTGSETKNGAAIPGFIEGLGMSKLVRYAKLKKPINGANYRIIYLDAPGLGMSRNGNYKAVFKAELKITGIDKSEFKTTTTVSYKKGGDNITIEGPD